MASIVSNYFHTHVPTIVNGRAESLPLSDPLRIVFEREGDIIKAKIYHKDAHLYPNPYITELGQSAIYYCKNYQKGSNIECVETPFNKLSLEKKVKILGNLNNYIVGVLNTNNDWSGIHEIPILKKGVF